MINHADEEPAVDVPGAVDVVDEHYVMAREGRVRHIVRGTPDSSLWPLGADVSPLCGRPVRLTRIAHPSDPTRVCRECDRVSGG